MHQPGGDAELRPRRDARPAADKPLLPELHHAGFRHSDRRCHAVSVRPAACVEAVPCHVGRLRSAHRAAAPCFFHRPPPWQRRPAYRPPAFTGAPCRRAVLLGGLPALAPAGCDGSACFSGYSSGRCRAGSSPCAPTGHREQTLGDNADPQPGLGKPAGLSAGLLLPRGCRRLWDQAA